MITIVCPLPIITGYYTQPNLIFFRFLEHIEPLAFHNLKSLEFLECQNNKELTSIDPFAFYDNLEQQTR